jgi:hypothetical protein
MTGKVTELKQMLSPHTLADSIVHEYNRYREARQPWIEENKELRNYLFATDTSRTSNQDLPWRNSTTLPKLTQIRDNLHANYISALFPNDQWLKWEAHSFDDAQRAKAEAIEGYMLNKTREGGFRSVISKLLLDYIDYGNAFADVTWVSEMKIDEATGQQVPGYVGPKCVRISPIDILMNPTAPDFESSPKLTRTLMTLGELKVTAIEHPEKEFLLEAIEEAIGLRGAVRNGNYTVDDFDKAVGYEIDGFGNLFEYYSSFYTELIEIEGDIHDPATGILLKDRVITVMDRQHIIRNEPRSTWLYRGSKAHTSWRKRPDNLYGMGPLDNLVGMQYRIDHLENLKADVFDLIAFPPLKIIGEVEEFTWAPRSEIHIDSDGSDVQMLVPDTTALNADTQIAILEQRMEEYAGAPKEAMGFRTPGEKTAFEVEQLQTAAARIFLEKVRQFEEELLEPILNAMFETSRRNMEGEDLLRVYDDEIGATIFLKVTKEDITASGKLRPIGASHYAARSKMAQDLSGIFNSQVGQMIIPHTSTKALSALVEDLFGLERFALFSDNIGIAEQAETARMVQTAQQDVAAEGQVPVDAGQNFEAAASEGDETAVETEVTAEEL